MHFTQFTRAWNKKLQPKYRLKSFVSVDVRKSLGVKRNFIVSIKQIVYIFFSFLKAIKKNESKRWFLNRFAAFFFLEMFWLSFSMLSIEILFRFLWLVMICLSFSLDWSSFLRTFNTGSVTKNNYKRQANNWNSIENQKPFLEIDDFSFDSQALLQPNDR